MSAQREAAGRKALAALLHEQGIAPGGCTLRTTTAEREWTTSWQQCANREYHETVAACLIAAGVRLAPDPLSLDPERLYRIIADTAWDEATSPVGDPVDGIEQHDLRTLALAIAREWVKP